MIKQNIRSFLLVMSLLLFVVLVVQDIQALPVYDPPELVIVEMYRLNTPADDPNNVGDIFQPPELCTNSGSTSTRYGCTEFINEWQFRYPYSTNPAIVDIEKDYLLDVVSQEMGSLGFHPTAQQAQAIVARSYAYHRNYFDSATGTPVMNNSTQSQVFVPYRWEKWGNQSYFSPNSTNPCSWWPDDFLPQQIAICNAVHGSPNYYVTGLNHIVDLPETPLNERNAPAFAKYFKDAYAFSPTATLNEPSTVPGSSPPKPVYPYLIGVTDPVSSNPNVGTVGHRHGMSQNGASRWAYGNESWQGTLDRWSVQWTYVEQILYHYFTGSQVRDSNGNPVTPNERWNPLAINWSTSDRQAPKMQHGSNYPITVEVQNTGLNDWDCNFPSENYRLKYRWTKDGNQTNGLGQASVCGTDIGEQTSPLNITIQNIPNWGAGTYGLHFDVESINGVSRLWSTYTVLVCVGNEPCGDVFVPIVLKP